jgi:hypothetical protein
LITDISEIKKLFNFRGNPRFPLTPSRPFGLEKFLTNLHNNFFYAKFIEISWIPGGYCCSSYPLPALRAGKVPDQFT